MRIGIAGGFEVCVAGSQEFSYRVELRRGPQIFEIDLGEAHGLAALINVAANEVLRLKMEKRSQESP